VRGLGCALIEVERLRGVVKRRGQPFLERVFTRQELDYCQRHADPIPQLAARWAAKEAVVKALGTGFGEQIGFKDVSITHGPAGQPQVLLSERVAAKLGHPQLLVTLSHTQTMAMAVVCWY
jgi:holo-[acyl-carrier protein] synthase